MNANSYYEIGAGHVHNQDYAGSGSFFRDGKRYFWTAVSDGCSGSEDSDFGSRFLVKTFPTVANLSIDGDPQLLAERIQEMLVGKIKQGMNLDLPKTAFDATLVAALYDEAADTLYTFIWGDGKVFYKHRGQENAGTLVQMEFKSNAPFYLSYLTNIEKELRYEEIFGTAFGELTTHIVKPDGLVHLPEADKTRQCSHFQIWPKISESNIASVSVFTDGIGTYHRKEDSNIMMPIQHVLAQLTSYKNLHGEFVLRRMQMVKRYCEKKAGSTLTTLVFQR